MRLQELLLMLFDSCPGALIHPLLVNDWPFTGICPAIACKVSLPSEAKWNAQKAAFCWHQGLTSALGQGQTQVSWTSSGTGDCQEWLIFNVAKFAVLTINVCFRGHNFSRYHVTLPLLDPSASAWTSPYVEGCRTWRLEFKLLRGLLYRWGQSHWPGWTIQPGLMRSACVGTAKLAPRCFWDAAVLHV